MSNRRNMLHAPHVGTRRNGRTAKQLRNALRGRLSGAVAATPRGQAINALRRTAVFVPIESERTP